MMNNTLLLEVARKQQVQTKTCECGKVLVGNAKRAFQDVLTVDRRTVVGIHQPKVIRFDRALNVPL